MTELQKLEQQVAELQATIERMKKLEPIKQWEPQGGEWWIRSDGKVDKNGSSVGTRLNGNEYKTKEQAEWARDQMRSFNRLLCYVAEFDVDENGVQWMPDWEDNGKLKHVVSYDHTDNKWFYDFWNSRQDVTVYMSEQCAKKLADKLNSGEVVL